MNPPTHYRRVSIALAVLALVAIAGVATQPGLAQSDDESLDDELINTSEDVSGIDIAIALGDGLSRRFSLWADSLQNRGLTRDSDREQARQYAQDTREYFNANNDSFRQYLNDHDSGGTDKQVLELRFSVDGETEPEYIVGDWNTSDGDYDTLEMVDTTDRAVDKCIPLADHAARNAETELERFHEQFVETDTVPDRAYAKEMAAAYPTAAKAVVGEGC